MSYKMPLAKTTDFGTMKVGDGLTVTNGTVSATGLPTESFYGKFFSSANQTNPVISTPNLIIFPNTALNNGISTTGADITFTNAGVYTITYEVQAGITSGGGGDIDVWIRVNGVDLINSNSITTIPGGGNNLIINRSFLVSLTAGSVVRTVWESPVLNMQLTATPAQVGPVRPATNSANFLATLVKAL